MNDIAEMPAINCFRPLYASSTSPTADSGMDERFERLGLGEGRRNVRGGSEGGGRERGREMVVDCNRMEVLRDEEAEKGLHYGEQGIKMASRSENGDSTSTVQKKRFPEEEDEDLLRETNDRFVLFPIKYHEVSCDPHGVWSQGKKVLLRHSDGSGWRGVVSVSCEYRDTLTEVGRQGSPLESEGDREGRRHRDGLESR